MAELCSSRSLNLDRRSWPGPCLLQIPKDPEKKKKRNPRKAAIKLYPQSCLSWMNTELLCIARGKQREEKLIQLLLLSG